MRRNTPRSPALLVLAASLLLGGCTVRQNTVDTSVVRGQQLTPCSIEGTPFADIDFADWRTEYQRNVNAIVTEFFDDDATNFLIDCRTIDQGDGSEIAQPGSALLALARQLPPWADETRPVTRLSTGDVLRTYLDAYLCSLEEQRFILSIRSNGDFASSESTVSRSTWSSDSSLESLDRGDANELATIDRAIIDHELLTAAPALERVLTLMSSDHRTTALKVNLECILRASTDLRNALSLLSEAMACVGRLWETQGVFRDFPATTSE